MTSRGRCERVSTSFPIVSGGSWANAFSDGYEQACSGLASREWGSSVRELYPDVLLCIAHLHGCDPVPVGQIYARAIRRRRQFHDAPGRTFENLQPAMNVREGDDFCHDVFCACLVPQDWMILAEAEMVINICYHLFLKTSMQEISPFGGADASFYDLSKPHRSAAIRRRLAVRSPQR